MKCLGGVQTEVTSGQLRYKSRALDKTATQELFESCRKDGLSQRDCPRREGLRTEEEGVRKENRGSVDLCKLGVSRVVTCIWFHSLVTSGEN